MIAPEQHDESSGWIDVDFHISDTYAAIDEAFAELWNDPAMADYDRYEEIMERRVAKPAP